MQIDIWSDIACPWCFIGKKRFEAALEQFEHRESVNVVFHSFQLNPNAPTRFEGAYTDYLINSENLSLQQAKQNIAELENEASEIGITFDFENQVIANTMMGHQVLQMAQDHGRGGPMMEALMRAYFVDGQDLSDVMTLVDLAVTHGGLDQRSVVQDLVQGTYSDQLSQDALQAAEFGIDSVPFLAVNLDFGVPGAQSVETFLDVLNQCWQEHNG